MRTASDSPSLKLLYDQHRWFELRSAMKGRAVSPLYEGAVAAAFNGRKKAEENLQRAVRLRPNSHEAEEAHEILANFYIRLGRYKEAVRQLDQALRIKPENVDAKNARAIFAAWSTHPDQSTERFTLGRIQAEVSEHGGVKLPLSIHGKTVHWVLDTGANFSVMSDSEAQSLGVSIDESSAEVKDSAGGTTKMRTAMVDDLVIGDMHLRNVAFLVLPDSQQPMSDLPPGQRGLVGIQIPIALGAIDWRSDGTFQFGHLSKAHSSEKNLSFDDLNPVVRGAFDGKEVDCVLDSGNAAGSQLWSRFAQDFDAFVKEHGTNSKQQVTMVGGSTERETTMLPKVTFRFGGLDATLRAAQVFSKPVGDDHHHCLLGLDVLSQAREVRIDFRSMSLQLVP